VIEIRKILAPTDFSPHAAKAVCYAARLAERLDSELHLLHVLSEVVPAGPEPLLVPVLPPEYYQETEEESRIALARSFDPAWGHPRAIEAAVRWDSPVEGVVEYARSLEIDLIVIATHGRTGLSHVLLGSVAERIVREAPCPVLTIRDRDRTPPPRGV
jgi:nucleotide-binding universal stress UspA family protein